MKKLVLAIALLLLIPVMLVGCSTSESAGVKSSINGFTSAFNAGNYEKCTDYLLGMTNDTVKQQTAQSLEAAKAFVEKIEVTKIEDIEVNGSSAKAKVTYKVTLSAALGGASQEDTAQMTLTKADGKWKFGMDDFLDFDMGG